MPGLRWKEEYETAILFQHLSLWDALPYTHEVRGPLYPDFPPRNRNIYSGNESQNPTSLPSSLSNLNSSMENLPVNNGNGQAYGYPHYETTITRGGSLKSGHNIQDRALVSAGKRSSRVLRCHGLSETYYNHHQPESVFRYCWEHFIKSYAN